MDDDASSTNSIPDASTNPLITRANVNLSPGANGILDVTPVNSFSAVDEQTPPSGHLARLNEDAFSSSSDDDAVKDNEGGKVKKSQENEDSSVKSAPPMPIHAEDGAEEQGDRGQMIERQSEWDKALRKGKPNTGHASKFFSESKGVEDFLTRADSDVLEETASKASQDGSHEKAEPPPSSVVSAASSSTLSYHAGAGKSKYPPAPASVVSSSAGAPTSAAASFAVMRPHPTDNLSSGVLPDVLIAMRQRIESLTLFDSDMMRMAGTSDDDPMLHESIESLKRSFHQSISAAVLVSLSHKRYERRRLAAMEIEKVVRSLLQQGEVERVRAILLLLSDDYVRSTSEDARKGGVVALAACAVGMKKAAEKESPVLQECRDLILASVVHACQDHNQRVRYYATESLFNVVKIMPVLAIQHFFILFEILRSLYADVDVDVRSGAELLDKKLKDVIVHAINSGTFTVESCVPVFARFVYIRNKVS